MSQSTTIPSLPDDLLVSCFARVSRLYYPTLSLVSKRFRSILASPELYKARSSLDNTECCLYVCLGFSEISSKWYTLSLKPDQTLTHDKNTTKYVLSPISPSHSPIAHPSSLVAVGSNIYSIGGPTQYSSKSRSSNVLVLDCQSNTWRKAPNMLMKRNYPTVSVLDEKIYVIGGSYNSMEVFDTKTQAWEMVSSPTKENFDFNSMGKCLGIEGKIHILGGYFNPNDKSVVTEGKMHFLERDGLAYNTKEGKWEELELQIKSDWPSPLYFVIDNVLYYYTTGGFAWFDTTANVWRRLYGMEEVRPYIVNAGVIFADYGGKMAIFWEGSKGYDYKNYFCAVVVLERRNNKEIWGSVEWHGLVLTGPWLYGLERALAVTV